MRFWTLPAVFAVSAALAMWSGAVPAHAGQAGERAQGATEFSSQNSVSRITTNGRTQVRVNRRSYLDAGTEVLPGERKFQDYAFPPAYSPLDAAGPDRNYDRKPLNGFFDVPHRY